MRAKGNPNVFVQVRKFDFKGWKLRDQSLMTRKRAHESKRKSKRFCSGKKSWYQLLKAERSKFIKRKRELVRAKENPNVYVQVRKSTFELWLIKIW